jgi:hypothetical protein
VYATLFILGASLYVCCLIVPFFTGRHKFHRTKAASRDSAVFRAELRAEAACTVMGSMHGVVVREYTEGQELFSGAPLDKLHRYFVEGLDLQEEVHSREFLWACVCV